MNLTLFTYKKFIFIPQKFLMTRHCHSIIIMHADVYLLTLDEANCHQRNANCVAGSALVTIIHSTVWYEFQFPACVRVQSHSVSHRFNTKWYKTVRQMFSLFNWVVMVCRLFQCNFAKKPNLFLLFSITGMCKIQHIWWLKYTKNSFTQKIWMNF